MSHHPPSAKLARGGWQLGGWAHVSAKSCPSARLKPLSTSTPPNCHGLRARGGGWTHEMKINRKLRYANMSEFDNMTERWSKPFVAKWGGRVCPFCTEPIEVGDEAAFVSTRVSDDMAHAEHRDEFTEGEEA